jgi:hypothetical protein
MFIVPLSGDKIQSSNGARFTALGYTNVKDQPAVYVQGADVETSSIPFDQITKINGTPVTMTGGKIFNAAKRPSGKFSLPQKDDKVRFGGKTLVKVDTLKANQRGHLAAGLLVIGTDVETKNKITARLADLVSIERANGSELFDLKAFKSEYRDYLGAPA